MTEIDTQKKAILSVLMEGRRLTSASAFRIVGTMKLPTRIGELKRAGWNIKSIKLPAHNRFNREVQINEYYLGRPWRKDIKGAHYGEY